MSVKNNKILFGRPNILLIILFIFYARTENDLWKKYKKWYKITLKNHVENTCLLIDVAASFEKIQKSWDRNQ